MAELEALGLSGQRGKVFVNCIVKLGRAQMQGATRFIMLQG